jgi:hypothetical protein
VSICLEGPGVCVGVVVLVPCVQQQYIGLTVLLPCVQQQQDTGMVVEVAVFAQCHQQHHSQQHKAPLFAEAFPAVLPRAQWGVRGA